MWAINVIAVPIMLAAHSSPSKPGASLEFVHYANEINYIMTLMGSKGRWGEEGCHNRKLVGLFNAPALQQPSHVISVAIVQCYEKFKRGEQAEPLLWCLRSTA